MAKTSRLMGRVSFVRDMSTEVERVVWNPPSHGVVCIGDVLAQLWETEAPTPAFRSILSWCEARQARTSAPLWMITVVGETATMPDGEARKIAAEFPHYFTEFVMVIKGSGFRASVVRSVLAGMAMLASRRAAPHIVATLSEGAQLLDSFGDGTLNAAQLHGLLGELRAELRR